MALAKNAKQPVRGAAAVKSVKTAAKVVKDGKKAAPAKINTTVKVAAKAPAKISSVKLKEKPKAKSAAEQPKAAALGAAKAALKRENTGKRPAASTDKPATPVKAKTRKISIDINPSEAASALSQKWNTLYKKAEQIDAKPYNMKAVFEEKTAIVHKVLGWGYILANRNDRLEVLFKDGIKYLISNYKP